MVDGCWYSPVCGSGRERSLRLLMLCTQSTILHGPYSLAHRLEIMDWPSPVDSMHLPNRVPLLDGIGMSRRKDGSTFLGRASPPYECNRLYTNLTWVRFYQY